MSTFDLPGEAGRIAAEAMQLGIGLSPAAVSRILQGSIAGARPVPGSRSVGWSDSDEEPEDEIGSSSSSSSGANRDTDRLVILPLEKESCRTFPAAGFEAEFACDTTVSTILSGVSTVNEMASQMRCFLDGINPSLKQTKTRKRKRSPTGKSSRAHASTTDSFRCPNEVFTGIYDEYPEGTSLVSIVLFDQMTFGCAAVKGSCRIVRRSYKIPRTANIDTDVELQKPELDSLSEFEYEHPYPISQIASTVSDIWFVDAVEGVLGDGRGRLVRPVRCLTCQSPQSHSD